MPTVYSPPVSTYIALATTTLGATASSITFSSIPATYRDLVLIASGATTTSDTTIKMNFNNDTTDSYSYVQMYGETSGTGSDSNTLENIFGLLGGTSGVGVIIWNIMDYSATDKHKTVLARENPISIDYVGARASRWPQTTAINEIDLTPRSGNFAIGTTISLFGIEA